MSETINDKNVFSLLEVTLSIQKTLSDRYKSSFWVKAEMNKLNHYSHSGHCYPELVEKKDGKVIAQLKSILWKSDFQRINESFLTLLKEPIKDGIKILFCAAVTFDPSYGLSLRIIDIDPSFSLGELEREKQESIARLNHEQIFHSNRKLSLALLPQRIAVISVETSKGYADYLKVIEQNPWNYKFFNMLFPSLLQGDRSVTSIIAQLRRIKKVVSHFDAVAIIRGGGGDVGLSSYNNYELAREIALFPLPVLTGIGHSTNETVAEMVSFRNMITPTELADFLIQKFHDFSIPVKRAEEVITSRSARTMQDEKLKFYNIVRYFKSVTSNRLIRSHHDVSELLTALAQHTKILVRSGRASIENSSQELERETSSLLNKHRQQVDALERQITILDPINILKRGFSLTLNQQGKVINDFSEVEINETITTLFANGKIISKVKDKQENE